MYAVAPTKTLDPPWSYSSLNDFETCPRRFYEMRVAKRVKDTESEHMADGNAVHKSLELYVQHGRPLPEKHERFKPVADIVLATPGTKQAELSFGLTQSLQPTDFFARDVWVRGKLDLTITNGTKAIVLDWKTGKVKTDPSQLDLFAAAAFALNPALTHVKAGYVWLAHGSVTNEKYTRDRVEPIWLDFRRRAGRIAQAARENEYVPKPSGLCRKHCAVPFSRCEFSGTAG